ncbi:MAG: bifunctional lysylphosphatidylglycerol flippase/synthetase MprF [Acidimicrobiales bacterium]
MRESAPAYRRVRRWSAGILLVAGVIDVVSAATPPLRDRVDFVRRVLPLVVPEVAITLVALSGLALMLLSRGVRKGHRLAWTISIGVLVASAIGHLLKAGEIEQGLVAAAAVAYLAYNWRAFGATGDRPSLIRGAMTLVAGGMTAIVAGVAGVELYHPGVLRRPPIGHAIRVVTERLVGIYSTPLRQGRHGHFNTYVAPGLTSIGIGLAAYALALAFRPVVLSRRPPPGDYSRARDIVRRWGSDTLAYFALRDDKRWWFYGDSVVAYAVIGGVCLVSPDPIGPADEHTEAWREFHRFADDHGWPVAVMGAGEDWLDTYRSAGMRDLYIGDEAVVDCQTFKLEGGEMKGLRQAVNRIAKYGYRMEFYDPARVGPDLRAQLRGVMAQNRRGDAERGFSMTLGRIFDPDDRGFLLAVAYGPEGEPVAFCHYVPAPGIHGYSLDMMRRTDGPHPNGLIDFVVVRTIEHLKAQRMTGLGLNFATMRAVLAGETGAGMTQRVERWFLRKMSDSMQIESLWKYNAKFAPAWHPRYAVYDAPENMLPAALAVARAESWFELPVIGRFLATSPETEVATSPETEVATSPETEPLTEPVTSIPSPRTPRH